MQAKHIWSILALLVLTVSVGEAVGSTTSPRYSITDLGVLPGNQLSEANSINNKGQIVGVSADYFVMTYRNSHAVLFEDGKVQDLGSLPLCKDFSASGINSQGAIVGTGQGMNGLGDPKVKDPYIEKGFVWRDGVIRDIGMPQGRRQASATQINDLGEIAGTVDVDGRAFVYKDGRFTLLPLPKGFTTSEGVAINDKGQVAVNADSEHAFLYDHGRMVDPGSFGTKQTSAGGIGPDGSVVGEVDMPQTDKNGNHFEHAFVWRPGRRMVDLGSLGGIYADALAINKQGEIVGWSQLKVKNFNPTIDTERALLWRNAKMYNLNDLIPEDSGWLLTEARSINDKGQIVGVGVHDGKRRAFLLTPTDMASKN